MPKWKYSIVQIHMFCGFMIISFPQDLHYGFLRMLDSPRFKSYARIEFYAMTLYSNILITPDTITRPSSAYAGLATSCLRSTNGPSRCVELALHFLSLVSRTKITSS